MLNEHQEEALLETVKEQNDLTLKQMQQIIVSDELEPFSSMQSVSLHVSTIYRVLKKRKVTLKALYTRPVSKMKRAPRS